MKCIPCNGSGLISSTEVCSLCKGIGHDGLEMEIVETKIESKPKKKK